VTYSETLPAREQELTPNSEYTGQFPTNPVISSSTAMTPNAGDAAAGSGTAPKTVPIDIPPVTAPTVILNFRSAVPRLSFTYQVCVWD